MIITMVDGNNGKLFSTEDNCAYGKINLYANMFEKKVESYFYLAEQDIPIK